MGQRAKNVQKGQNDESVDSVGFEQRRINVRRKKSGLWFPCSGTTHISGDETFVDAAWDNVENGLAPPTTLGGPTSLQVKALTFDYTQESPDALAEGFSLRDVVEGQDWMCQRIVGKFFAQYLYGGDSVSDDWMFLKVALGIFVARSKDRAQGEPDLEPDEFDPFHAQNIQDSWMFRRTWILSNPENPVNDGADPPSTGLATAPFSTAGFGSVMDGPHIDCKSKRRINREHRLWAVVGLRGFSPGFASPGTPNQGFLYFNFDFRIHGTMRRGSNKAATL